MKTLASLAAEYPQFKFERTPGGYAAWDMAANDGRGALQAGARTVKRLAEKLDPAFSYDSPTADTPSGRANVPLLEAARIASVQMQNAIELLADYAETDRWAEAIHAQLVRDEAMLRAAIARAENVP